MTVDAMVREVESRGCRVRRVYLEHEGREAAVWFVVAPDFFGPLWRIADPSIDTALRKALRRLDADARVGAERRAS